MTCRLAAVLCAALASACGARPLSGDGNSSGASEGTGEDGQQVPSVTGVTSSSATPTSSPTSFAEPTSSSASTTTLDTSPIPGTWEGVTQRNGSFSLMSVCDFGEVCIGSVPDVVWCENVYFRAVGTMRWDFQGIGGCNGWHLDIEELLEARACEPTDCEAGCSGPLRCEPECHAAMQDCPDGYKCVAHTYEELPEAHPRRCVPIPATPFGEGEACTVAAATDEGYDDCDRGLHCWAEEPAATTGVCVPFCHPNDPGTCPTDCVQCTFGSEGLCLTGCPACNLSHSC